MTKKAAIIGGGVIGGGWLARFLLNGWDIKVFDPDPEAERKISEVLKNARHALPMLYDQPLPNEGTLKFCKTIKEAVSDADWIQESVPERLDIKHRVFAEIQDSCRGDAVIGSSTSGFKPSELQEGAERPEQIMVTHPFNPVYLLPLIELVPSIKTGAQHIETAKEVLASIGLYPLHVRKEIDAHIADRFLEAVWREGLWLIKDGIATTEEIDNAIRYGFGLRWAQMGLFETYRIAGGEAGMAHFIAQFGPCLSWPWTKLMDVPELTDELTQMIADQSDAQSGHKTIRELERLRDNNLIAIMRALKQQGSAAGALITAHEETLRLPLGAAVPMRTVSRSIPVDWTDYNGHMNEGRYGQIFSDAADAFMIEIGADAEYIAAGNSFFTAETTIKYLAETLAGQTVHVNTRVLLSEGKKVKLFHEMRAEDNAILATCEQFMLHVNLTTRKSCPPLAEVQSRMDALAQAHKESA
ncbi:MAG: carnitine 3-dehydrogenase [Rhodobacteraceae bacterium]|jgi:carnitine 3-dehydrogenase|nr:carnitine 3-dehydrogenase [Paracoccaceae bacterium]